MPAAARACSAQTTPVAKSLANGSSRTLPVDGTEKTEVLAAEERLGMEGEPGNMGLGFP